MDVATEVAVGELGSPTEVTQSYFDGLSDKFSNFATDLFDRGYGISRNQFIASAIASFIASEYYLVDSLAKGGLHMNDIKNVGISALGSMWMGIFAYISHESKKEESPNHPKELWNESPEITAPLFPKRNLTQND